jgi:carbamoyltransferase
MKLLAIPFTYHDTSLCILTENYITSYKMEERFSRKKHDQNLNNILNDLSLKKDFYDVIVVIKPFLSHAVTDHISFNIVNEIIEKIKSLNFKKILFFDEQHHIYHAYCGFYNSKFEEALCFSVDGFGALLENKNLEIESVYYFNNKSHKEIEIYKKTIQGFKTIEEIDPENYSVGKKYEVFATDTCNFSHFDSGKVMGLAQYKNYKKKLQYPYNTKEWKERVDGAYDLQQKTQNHVLDLIKKYTKETGIKNVVISGGYGLNCVANYHYLKNLKDINLYIDPVCFDAGISIGAAYYHYIQETQNNQPIQPLSNVYIGHQETSYDLKNLQTQKVSYEDIVNLILQKNIVALFQGKSEAGQRALGNRSLLFDPRVMNGKDIVNQIKKRENFRPFAGSILQEEASKWFDMLSLKESPYMQYAVNAYDNAIEQAPAIIHADNTCRIQTVTQKQNKHFYNLISCFFGKTGVPMLLNTSFNLGGEPLVETFNHAVYTLKNSMIEYLYLPEIETLVTIKNKNLMYQ